MAESGPEQQSRPGVVTPGELLRAARLAKGLELVDVAHALNWLPGYVTIIEENRHQDLRSPAFGRGYVKAYARLVDVNQPRILRALDEWEEEMGETSAMLSERGSRRPPQLQKSGLGVFSGLAVLGLLVAGLWLWQGGTDVSAQPQSITVQPAAPSSAGGSR